MYDMKYIVIVATIQAEIGQLPVLCYVNTLIPYIKAYGSNKVHRAHDQLGMYSNRKHT